MTGFYDNRYLLGLAIAILLIAGASALVSLPRLEDPRIANRNPSVITLFPGASAERVEAEITDPLEDALRTMFEIKEIQSTSRAGVSFLQVTLEDWVDESTNEAIFSKMRDEIAQASRAFPPGAGSPVLDDKRVAIAYTLIVGLAAPEPYAENLTILDRLARELADRLRNAPGTELVRLFGAPDEEIRVLLDEQAVAALGITADDVARSLAGADAKRSAGALRGAANEYLLEVRGEFDSLARIERIPIATSPGGGTVLLGDIAAVEKAWRDPPTELALQHDRRTIMVAARMEGQIRIDRWTEGARAVLAAFEADYGASVDLQIVYEQLDDTNEKLATLTGNLFGGIAIVMVVVLLFMGWKPALTVGFALPLVLAGTLFSLGFFGEEIHQMTIFGMIVAIGLLIDNAIVVTNDVRRNVRERDMAPRAALAATIEHLRAPLLASTVTTILGFMPIFLLPGNVGDFVGPIAIAVVMALAFSYLVSMTIIAPLAAIVKSADRERPHRWWRNGLRQEALSRAFRRLLRAALRRPRRTLLACCVLPALGFLGASTLANEFFPSADRDHFQIQLWLPPQTPIEATRVAVEAIDGAIRARDGVTRTSWVVGGSHPKVYYNQLRDQDNVPSYAQAIVHARDVATANRLIPELQALIDGGFPAVRGVVRAFGQGPPTPAPIEFRVVGDDLDQLRMAAEAVRLAMSRHPAISQHLATIEGGQPKLWLDADEDAARLAGLSLQAIAGQLQAALDGALGGSVLEGTEEVPVRIRLADANRSDLARLATVPLQGAGAERWIPAIALGELTLRPALQSITRRDGFRAVNIRGFLNPGATPIDVTRAIAADLEATGFTLPPGYRLEVGGDADQQQEALALLARYLPVLLTLMAAVLILTFRSLALAGLIGAVALLSAGLGFLALTLAGFPLGFNPIIGSTGLIGVAINDTIIVLAAIRANPAAAAGDQGAIVDEVLGTARHVLSTTLTTAGGFLPLLLSGGSFWPPLAVVIAGGIVLATYLALVLTPTAYMVLAPRLTGEGSEARPAQDGEEAFA